MKIECHHVQFFTAVCNDWLHLLEGDEAKDIIIRALHYQVKAGHVKVAAFVIIPLVVVGRKLLFLVIVGL